MAVRKLLDYVFTQGDLYWLDHLLPDDQIRAKEDEEEDNEEAVSLFGAHQECP